MAKGGFFGGIMNSLFMIGLGGAATIGGLWYFGLLKVPEITIPSGYARSRLGFGGTGNPPFDTDYTKYMPDYENMSVSLRPTYNDPTLDNTLRDMYPPIPESDGYNPADPPISLRDEMLSNW